MEPFTLSALRVMLPGDYAPVRALWEQTENIGLNESDEPAAIASFLARNPGLSPVASLPDGRIIGAMLCGHDGRRGYLHHLAVARDHRGHGLGRALIEFAVQGLRQLGITKCNLFLFEDSHDARAFWEYHGWRHPDWLVMQKRILGDDTTACAGNRRGTC